MTRKRYPRFATRLPLLCVLVLAFVLSASAEWKEKVLYSFQGGTDGSTPAGGVVFDKAGNLYGATSDGGAACPLPGCGVAFQLASPAKQGEPWIETVLHIFTGNGNGDGATPAGGLSIDGAGNLYGTTGYGGTGNCVLLGSKTGCGVVYELIPPKSKGGQWTEKILYSFQGGKDGDFPAGNLTFDKAGNLYGATQYGGGFGSCNAPYFQNCGVVFKLSPPAKKGGKWTEKVLYSFKSGTDGANPNGGLVLDSEGAIYGTTYAGGNQDCKYDSSVGCGTAFALQSGAGFWSEVVIHRFDLNAGGANPAAGMTFDAMGYLYGTTAGAIFQFAPPAKKSGHWKETVLHKFNNNAYDPEATLIFDAGGNLYGTTNVGSGGSLQGSVFRLKPPQEKAGSWTFSVIHGFLGPPDGDFPAASLILDVSGDVYSTTQAGGTGTGCGQGGCGTVFEVEP
jgi:hypothetical protein